MAECCFTQLLGVKMISTDFYSLESERNLSAVLELSAIELLPLKNNGLNFTREHSFEPFQFTILWRPFRAISDFFFDTNFIELFNGGPTNICKTLFP